MLESDSKTVRFDLSNYQELVIDVPRLRLSNIFKHYPSPSPFPSFPFPSSLSFGTFALNSQNYNPLFEKMLDTPLRSYRRFIKVVIGIIILVQLFFWFCL